MHVSTARSWRGGEQQLLNLACGLDARGLGTEIIAPKGQPLVGRARDVDLVVTEIGGLYESNVFAMCRIARRARALGASMLHAHDAHATTLAAVAGRLARAPVVATRRVAFKPSAWKYNHGVERIICISQAVRDACDLAGVRPQRIRQVYDGIDLSPFSRVSGGEVVRKRWLGKYLDAPLILIVAGLTPEKGHADLIDAMPKVIQAVPNARLLIVGKGKLEQSLKQRAARRDVSEACVFTGFCDDVPALLDACDVFIMPSHNEGLGTSVIEAMAVGRPVIASVAGGLREVVEDGVTGRLVPIGDPKALGETTIELLRNPAKRRAMGNAGRERAERFGIERMVAGTLDVYDEIWSEREV